MINTTLVYIENNEQYLLLHRNKKENDLNEGKWIGVGGKFEPGETAVECMLREVYEETGLTITGYSQLGLIKFISDKWEDEDMYLFLATEYTGTLKKDCPEGTLCFVPKDKVLELPTWEGDKYFLKPLLEGAKNINLTLRYEGDKLAQVIEHPESAVIEKSMIIEAPHGFSTRLGGVSEEEFASLNLGLNRGDVPARVAENWRRFLYTCGIHSDRIVCGHQVHSNHIHIASTKDLMPPYEQNEPIEADGYVTNIPQVPLAVFTADCVPLLMEDKQAGVIAAVHSGWRSTAADIAKEAIRAMCSLGATVDNIHVSIGPAIDMCCFEVGSEVIDNMRSLLGYTHDSTPLWNAKENGKYMLDLRGVVRTRLLQLGIKEDHIETVGTCTLCTQGRYYSHRRAGVRRGSLASVIMLE